MRYMYQRSELHFKTVYFVKENEEDNRIEECFLEGAMFDFITMEKNIEPVAKLWTIDYSETNLEINFG